MKQEIKERWINALRSGDYKQGVGRLRSIDDRYCCLGVLCDVVKSDLNLDWEFSNDIAADSCKYKLLGSIDYLPQSVCSYVGLSSTQGNIKDPSIYDIDADYSTLAEINDSEALDFDAIANIIEVEF
jgi:hypothetical protein